MSKSRVHWGLGLRARLLIFNGYKVRINYDNTLLHKDKDLSTIRLFFFFFFTGSGMRNIEIGLPKCQIVLELVDAFS